MGAKNNLNPAEWLTEPYWIIQGIHQLENFVWRLSFNTLGLRLKTKTGVGWVEERRPVGVRVSVSEREASRREGASRRVTQHSQGFVGFRLRSTQPTILLNPSVLG